MQRSTMAVSVLCTATLAGCGTAAPQRDRAETVTVTQTIVAASRHSPPVVTSPSVVPQRTKPAFGPRSAAAYTSCDANIRARSATTTCGWAENAFYSYYIAGGVGEDALAVYSPTTRSAFTTACLRGASRVVCRTADGGVAKFPGAAVDRYDDAQAAAYAASHDLGPDAAPAPPMADVPPADASPPDTACDPSYSGACLDPSSSDYDCEGGSGDGPDYTGPVTVVGADHFGLDRDGDGAACEG